MAWEGQSEFTGDKVQLIVTGIVRPSANPKTGPMAQSSIVVAGKHPLDVIGTPLERAICGGCKLGGCQGRKCYVYSRMLLHLARKFPKVSLGKAQELMQWIKGLRIGEYGDPAALPFKVWKQMLKDVRFFTGYTHAWQTCDPQFKRIVMASVDSLEERAAAKRRHWRTYRIRASADEPLQKGEIVCPYERKGLLCLECKLCCGTSRSAPDVVITAHGPRANAFRVLNNEQAA